MSINPYEVSALYYQNDLYRNSAKDGRIETDEQRDGMQAVQAVLLQYQRDRDVTTIARSTATAIVMKERQHGKTS